MIIPPHWQWFRDARFGLFIHWGPYAEIGRGEQVLIRERLDQTEYAQMACAWNPRHYDAREWAAIAKRAGFKYAVLTTCHHDGYCLWNTQYTDYSSGAQAPKRDFVREYVEAFKAEGIRVGLYYSLADFRVPAYFSGPDDDPEAWSDFLAYVHNQVRELLTNYGTIDVFWFDGYWPHSLEVWRAHELVEMMRGLQPGILINNRLGEGLGDFTTPEKHIEAEENKLWESCQITTSRLWGYAIGEHWRTPEALLDTLCEVASKAGNLLLNVGPQSDGKFPPPFVERIDAIGDWLRLHGEAIYGSDGGELCEFSSRGWQTTHGNALYLIIRFWDGRTKLTLPGLQSRVQHVELVSTGQSLPFVQGVESLMIEGLAAKKPVDLFPVIKLEFDEEPKAWPWAHTSLWTGDPTRYAAWAASRGTSVFADGKPR